MRCHRTQWITVTDNRVSCDCYNCWTSWRQRGTVNTMELWPTHVHIDFRSYVEEWIYAHSALSMDELEVLDDEWYPCGSWNRWFAYPLERTGCALHALVTISLDISHVDWPHNSHVYMNCTGVNEIPPPSPLFHLCHSKTETVFYISNWLWPTTLSIYPMNCREGFWETMSGCFYDHESIYIPPHWERWNSLLQLLTELYHTIGEQSWD